MQPWREQFPRLFAPTFIDYASADVQFSTETPPEELIARIHLVARHEQGIVVCVNDVAWRFLPGGTREPGETVEQILDRELVEEAGAKRSGAWSYLGAFAAQNQGDGPYRPHLPYPLAYWAFAVTDVDLVGPPTNPPDGEQVTEVLVLPPAEAAAFIAVHDSIHADIVRLADAMGVAAR